MVTELVFNNAYQPQREIYDKRYQDGRYDRRSHVRVLTAEREALRSAVARAFRSNPRTKTISLFDFGYGTGRVTNEFIASYLDEYARSGLDLLVTAYDVSSAGLQKAVGALCMNGFVPQEPMHWDPRDTVGYIVGRLVKRKADVTITVIFVHAHEEQPPERMRQLALQANNGQAYLVTTSWYSGLGHVPGQRLRREYFRQLGKLTSRRGEMVISVSSTGDLTELQPEFSERLANGDTGGFPLEAPGDLVYETELGQSNFYHVFAADLADHMKAITGWRQRWWLEGIRYPDEEFDCRQSERGNYRRVIQANKGKTRSWTEEDYREFHTVAAYRGRGLAGRLKLSAATAPSSSGGHARRPASPGRPRRA